MSSNNEQHNAPQQVIIKEKNSASTLSVLMSFFKFMIVIAVIVFIIFGFTSKNDSPSTSYTTSYESYNKYFDDMKQINTPVSDSKKVNTYSKSMFLIDFNGSPSGSEVDKLKRDIDFVLINSKQGDEVAIRLNSPGGSVSSYGLAAAELYRLKEAGLNVTVLVDQVAASGGYMMAVVSNKIIASPFAFVGSIGVVAQLPIYEDFLKKVGVDYKVYTAGDHKRSVVSQIKPTEEDENKLKDDLQKIHAQFKAHIKKYRSLIDIDKVANGQVFSGQEAVDLKLVDELSTSSDFLLKQHRKNVQIIFVYTEEVDKASNVNSFKASLNSVVDIITTKVIDELKSQVYNPYDNIQLKN